MDDQSSIKDGRINSSLISNDPEEAEKCGKSSEDNVDPNYRPELFEEMAELEQLLSYTPGDWKTRQKAEHLYATVSEKDVLLSKQTWKTLSTFFSRILMERESQFCFYKAFGHSYLSGQNSQKSDGEQSDKSSVSSDPIVVPGGMQAFAKVIQAAIRRRIQQSAQRSQTKYNSTF
ncbi:hypothetical protein ACOME3_000196 [Neoechinorhynchus agilis]